MSIKNMQKNQKTSKRLHLGCGQTYLDGYINIDYPSSEHSVQTESVADKYADLTELRYPANDIEEIRLHHVFEHFPRHIALALLAAWNSWLMVGGTLHIEVPDFTRTALAALNPLASKRRQGIALRHIFGSNEAHWATHFEGWTEANLRASLILSGFTVDKVSREAWSGIYNISIFAHKTKSLSQKQCIKNAESYLKNFTINETESETILLKTWMDEYSAQLKRSWATKNR